MGRQWIGGPIVFGGALIAGMLGFVLGGIVGHAFGAAVETAVGGFALGGIVGLLYSCVWFGDPRRVESSIVFRLTLVFFTVAGCFAGHAKASPSATACVALTAGIVGFVIGRDVNRQVQTKLIRIAETDPIED